MKFMAVLLIAFFEFCSAAYAQTPSDAELPSRLDIGSRFSVAAPTGHGWRPTGAPATFIKQLGPEDHSLVLAAATGPSGISREEIIAVRGSNGADKLVKLITRFVDRAWKSHAAGFQDARFETIDVVDETGGNYSFGKFFCGYSRIVVRDHGAHADDIPARLRYVAYSCVEFSDMAVAATVSYSERGREQDLSEEAMAEGERFARSLQRIKQ